MSTQAKTYPIPRAVMPKWVSRTFSLAMNGMVFGQLQYFGTQKLGLDVGVIGTLFLVAKVIDVISNFVVAYIVDNAHMKSGKGRPWDLWMVPAWVFTALAFLIPENINPFAQYAMVFLVYTFMNAVCWTFLWSVDVIYFNHAIKDENVRISVQAANGIVLMGTYTVAGIILPQLVVRFENMTHGFFLMSLLVGIPCLLIGSIRYFTIPEVDLDEQVSAEDAEPITIQDTFLGLTTNRFVLIITFLNLVINMFTAIQGAAAAYYFVYIVGDLGQQSVVSMFSILALVSLIVAVPMAGRIGRTRTLQIFFLISAVGCFLRMPAGANVLALSVVGVIAMLATYPFTSFSNLMYIDCMDYGEWKNGKRLEGAIFAGASLGATLGQGIGTAFAGIVMRLTGFVSGAASQSAGAIFGLRMVYAVIPGVLFALVAVVLQFYTLERDIPGIRKDLEERRTLERTSAKGADIAKVVEEEEKNLSGR